ncbi:MAG: preprotein translocase subunit SecG [bacterium]
MLTYLLYGLFILACIILVITVLLQPGKADAGALFSSSVSSTAFGPRGTASILGKITIGAAAGFMLLALILSLPAISGSRSVLQTAGADSEPPPAQQPSPAATTNPATSASPATTESPAAKASPSASKPKASEKNK